MNTAGASQGWRALAARLAAALALAGEASMVQAQPLQAVQWRDAIVLPVEPGGPAGRRLREVSGLAWDATRGHWWSTGDRGLLVAWSVTFEGGRLTARPLAVRALEGRPNAESIDVLAPGDGATAGDLAVLDEEAARWRRHDAQGRLIATAPLPGSGRADFRRGAEAMVRHPRHGLVVVPQRPARGAEGAQHQLLAEDGRTWTLGVAGERASIKAAHVDAAGHLLLLEKLASAPLATRWWLREVDLAACPADGRCSAAAVPLPVDGLADDDNLEGLACRDDAHCLLVSDDGRLAAPRTRLVWVALRRAP